MEISYSEHWQKKKKYRLDITDEAIEYVIENSAELIDKYWIDALNAITRVPPKGRLLKVIYKRLGNNRIKVITAFWLD